MKNISVIGSGTMGVGIAQLLSSKNYNVVLFDINEKNLSNSKISLHKILDKLLYKNKISKNQLSNIISKIKFTNKINNLSNSDIIIEAITENLELKKKLFSNINKIISDETILTSNTSSLSVTSLASSFKNPNNFIGTHFFNPAPVMNLVEVIPCIQTSNETLKQIIKFIKSIKKEVVIAKDTPGFIVNKVARPFYSEAIRIYEEGIATIYEIDFTMKKFGQFKMGPFELMDFIGNDINFTVTKSIYEKFFHESRYKPSLCQKRLVEAGYLGKKTGIGFYNYDKENNIYKSKSKFKSNAYLYENIFLRIISMLVNEAYDTLYYKIASKDDIETAVKNGVNYPKGLFEWEKEIGKKKITTKLEALYNFYREERYRLSPLLTKDVK
tara:strand:+ start:2957 stop:4108 length:1152 start_codon:yes stop_codon:yes gene_type:complete